MALLSLIGELAARAFMGTDGLYVSAEELWAVLAPESYEAMRAWFRQGALPFWSYGVGPALKFPAWFLFGAPGIALLWWVEKNNPSEEFESIAEAAALYDELTKQAQAEGYSGDSDRTESDEADNILASAKEAEADLARDFGETPPPGADPEPPNRPPS